jgi:hypothetical protein
MPADLERRLRELRAGFPFPATKATEDALDDVLQASRKPRRPRKARLALGLVIALLAASAVGFTVGRWAMPSRSLAATSISIAARPQTAVAWNELVALYGAVGNAQAGEDVKVEERECGIPGGQFHLVAETTSSAGGAWIANQDGTSVGATTRFRARWRNGTSDVITVYARPWLQLTKGPNGIFHLWIGGDAFFNGTAVAERLDQHAHRVRLKPVAVKRRTSGTGGVATFRASVARGTLVRVVLPAVQVKPCFLAGFSNPIKA